MNENNFVIGTKQTNKSLLQNNVKQCYIAKDADNKIIYNISEICNNNGIPIVYMETMRDIGKKFGIEVGAACAVELKQD
jgi:large subunit ribosomal protein L7A